MEKTTLADFLLARIAEDEAAAQAALALQGSGTHWPKSHPLDPSRALAECAAKRAILADRESIDRSAGMDDWYAGRSDANYDALYALASVYRDHPDYQREWDRG